jgi:hypothetical protein
LVDIYNNIIVDEGLLDSLRKSLVLWAGKYVSEENNIEKVVRGLKMSAQEVIDLNLSGLKKPEILRPCLLFRQSISIHNDI